MIRKCLLYFEKCNNLHKIKFRSIIFCDLEFSMFLLAKFRDKSVVSDGNNVEGGLLVLLFVSIFFRSE